MAETRRHVPIIALDALPDIALDEHLFDGRFRVETEAGVGGMGVVYRAVDEAADRPVALKVLRSTNEEAVQRFEREAEALRHLDHPAIVRYVAHGLSAEGEHYLALEWIEGESLHTHLARARAAGVLLTVHDVVELGYRLAGALSAAHQVGIVHRDVKPSNVLLAHGRLQEAKLADFGISRTASPSPATSSGVVLGTLGYMAPEQARGDHDLDGRVDLFSLGCVLFRCLTHHDPFEGHAAVHVLVNMLVREPRRVREFRPDVPVALDELIAGLLSKNRDERPPTAASVQAELARMATDTCTAAPISMGGLVASKSTSTPSSARRKGIAKRLRARGWMALPVALVGVLCVAGRVTPKHDVPETPSPTPAAPVPTGITARSAGPTCTAEASALYRQGLQALRASAGKRAHHLFEQAAAVDPSCPQAAFRLALTGDESQPSTRAREPLQRAMALRDGLDERDRLVLDAAALTVATDTPRHDEAFRRLDESTRRFPMDAELLVLTTLHRLLATDTSQALPPEVERTRAAIAIDPSYAEAWRVQAQVFSRLGRVDDELEALQHCLDVAPSAVRCMQQRIRVFRRLGRCQDVVSESRHWISWAPEDSLAYRELAIGLASTHAPAQTIDEALRLRWERLPPEEREAVRLEERAKLAAWKSACAPP